MESLPIDMSNPAVQDYLSLIRLQVLTPLSLLINIATFVVCALIVEPSIGQVARNHPTSISPKPVLIGLYVSVIFLGQIGYCVLLVLAGKTETKRTLTKGVGLSLVFANWVMALWSIAWVLQWFLVSTILLGILLLLLLYSNVALLVYHSPTFDRPFDIALIHAPLRFFLVLPLYLLFPYSLFITLKLTYDNGSDEGDPGSGLLLLMAKERGIWPGFGVVFGTNLLGLLVVIFRRDIIWCIAAVWLCVSVWSEGEKPPPVYITEILFTVLLPISLIASSVWVYLSDRSQSNERRIRLRGDDSEHPGLHGGGHSGRRSAGAAGENEGPREVDAEAVWGS